MFRGGFSVCFGMVFVSFKNTCLCMSPFMSKNAGYKKSVWYLVQKLVKSVIRSC